MGEKINYRITRHRGPRRQKDEAVESKLAEWVGPATATLVRGALLESQHREG
jgi:hypothetical protein